MVEYIRRIEKNLKAKGITAKKMLLDLGYSDSLISTWKKGSEPSAIKLMRIANYLETPVEYLLTGVEYKNEKEMQVMNDDNTKNITVGEVMVRLGVEVINEPDVQKSPFWLAVEAIGAGLQKLGGAAEKVGAFFQQEKVQQFAEKAVAWMVAVQEGNEYLIVKLQELEVTSEEMETLTLEEALQMIIDIEDAESGFADTQSKKERKQREVIALEAKQNEYVTKKELKEELTRLYDDLETLIKKSSINTPAPGDIAAPAPDAETKSTNNEAKQAAFEGENKAPHQIPPRKTF